MYTIVVVDEKGVKPQKRDTLSFDTINKICCRDTPEDEMSEAVYSRFKDERITIWCHHIGRCLPLQVYGVLTETGEDFCGPLVVTGLKITEDGPDIDGLTPDQVKAVLAGILPAVGVKAAEPSFRITTIKERPEKGYP